MIIALFCLAWLAAVLFPQTALSRAFRKWLVEAPAHAMGRLTAGRATLVLVVLVASLAILVVLKADGPIVLAQGLPEGIAWLVTFDIASYVDVAIVVVGATGLRGAQLLTRHATHRLANPPGRLRSRRGARRSGSPRPSRGEDPDWRSAAPAFA